MKLKFLTGVCIGPGQDAEAGQIHEVSDDNAKYFLNRGIAVKVAEEETPDQEPEEIQETTGKGKTETKKGTKK